MALNERLAILITADGKGAVRELQAVGKTAERELGKAGDASARTQQQLTKIGATAVTASAVAAVGLYKLGSAASDLEQAVGGAETVFGSASESVKSFSKDAADSFGLSNTAALQLTTQLGSLLQGFGFTEQASAGLSTQLTGLGSDLSAAFGGRPEEAVQALGSALRGEFDPLERYGVSLTAATIAQRAVAMGLAESTGEVDQHAKAQAALAIIYERTAKIQGQFGREADTAAGQLARNRAEFENLKAEVGEGVLPVMTSFLGVINGVVGGLGDLSPAVLATVGTVAALTTGAVAAAGAVSLVAGSFTKLAAAQASVAATAGATFGPMAAAAAALAGPLAAELALFTAIDQVAAGIADHGGKANSALQELLTTNDPSKMTALFGDLGAELDSAEGWMEGFKNEFGDTWHEIWSDDGRSPSRVKAELEGFNKVVAASVPQARLLADAMEDQGFDPEMVARYRGEIEKQVAADKVAAGEKRQLAAAQEEYNRELERSQYATAAIGAAGEQIAGIVGNLFGMGAAARATAVDFQSLASAVDAAFSAGSASERAAVGIANANARVADAQAAVAGTSKAASGGMGSAGDSALDAERKVRAYDDALRGVEDAQRAVVDAQDAVPDAERAVADANRGVEDAQRGVVDAARELVDAQQDVVDAQDGVARAARGVEEAQRGVVEANDRVVKGTKAVADAQQKVVDAQSASVDASTDLADAQDRLRKVTEGYGAASQEAADAQEALADAQRAGERAALGVADAQDKLQAAKDAQTTAVDFYGEGSDQAIKAARDVAKANLDLQDAQDRVKDTSKDQTEAQRKLNGTLTGFAAGTDEASKATDDLTVAQDKATNAAKAVGDATDRLAEQQKSLADANRGVGDAALAVVDADKALRDAHRAVEDAGRKVEDQQRAVADADRAVEDAHRRVTDATKGVEDANRAVTDALRGVEDATFRVREAEEARTQRLGGGAGGGAVRDQAALERDLAERLLDQRDAYIDVAEKAGERVDAQVAHAALLRGAPLSAEDEMIIKLGGQKLALEAIATTLDPSNPLRARLLDYSHQLGEIPDTADTSVALNADEAAAQAAAISDILEELGQGDVQAQATVTRIRSRLAALRGSNAQHDRQNLAEQRAVGGPVTAGRLYEVGEGNRPELYNRDGKLFLIPGNQGRVTPLGTGGTGDGGSNVTINGGIHMAGANPTEVGREIAWQARVLRRTA